MKKASTRLLEQETQTPSPAPDLIPAESSTENLHWDWYSKRGHFRGSGDKSERRREALTSSTGELVRNSAFLPRRVVRVYPPEATSSEKLVIGFAGAGACREMHPPVLEQYLAPLVN